MRIHGGLRELYPHFPPPANTIPGVGHQDTRTLCGGEVSPQSALMEVLAVFVSGRDEQIRLTAYTLVCWAGIADQGRRLRSDEWDL